MQEVILSLAGFGVVVTRDCMNRVMKKLAATPGIEARPPLSVLEVNVVTGNSTVSSLHGVEGAENSTVNKGCPVGTTKVNIAKSNSKKKDCITAIATAYQAFVDNSNSNSPNEVTYVN